MLKKATYVVLQLFFFLVLFFVGSVLPAFHKLPMWTFNASATHYFVLDGLLLMIVAFLLILAIEAARKRSRPWGWLTTLSFLLALALGLAMKFGMLAKPAGL